MKDDMSQSTTAIYTSPGFSEHLLNSLYSMQQSEKYCDLSLESETGVVRTHSLILLANSTLFQTWLEHQWGNSELVYKIPDLTLDELKNVVQFLYTGKLALCEDNVCSLMAFFEKLAIDKAVCLCRKFVTGTSQDVDSKRENVRDSGNVKSNASMLLSGDVVKVDGIHSEEVDNCLVSCKSQYDSEPEDDSSVAMTDLQKVESPESFPIRNSLDSDTKMFLCGNAVKVETVDDGFTYLKNVDSVDNKASQQCESLAVNMSSISSTCDTDLSVLPVKRKRGRPPGCKVRKNTFKLRCKGQKTQAKGKNKSKSVVKCKTKEEDVGGAWDDVTDISDIKEEPPEPTKKVKKMRQRKEYTRKYSCEFCDHKSIRFMELESHRHSKHDVPFDETKYTVYRCEMCSFETNIPKRLEKHRAIHTEERPNICEHCGKTFKLVNELNAHVQSHIFPEKFSCHICGKSFSSPFIVKDHVANIHLGHKKQFLCHLCCHVTADNRNLILHLWQKHQIPVPQKCKLFRCEECGFETLRKHKFNIHKKLHTGVRDHVCKVCGKGYLTGGALRAHMLWHSDKVHRCTFEPCSYSSPSKRQLDQHVRLMHTQRDMKPFACHLCSHRCSVRGNLDKHLRTVHSLKIPDKRRLSHLYNLGRCGRSRIPTSDTTGGTHNVTDVTHSVSDSTQNATTITANATDVTPDMLGTTHADRLSACATQYDRQSVENVTVPPRLGQGEANFSVPYSWPSFQNHYQNIHY